MVAPRLALILHALAVGAAVVGCGSPSVIKATCTDVSPQELNESASCLGPPVMDTGLQACTVGASPTGNEVPVCLISPEGRIFRGLVKPSATVRGAGWTHSASGSSASTLAAPDVARCAKVLPGDAGAVPACP
jgi:hypothetical protein